VATLRNSTASANLRHNGRVSLEILESDDLLIGILGTRRLIKEPLAGSEAMTVWEMQVAKVKQDTSPAQRVIQGPASLPRVEKAKAFEPAAFAEVVAAAKGG
jgi:hypothetical protein